MLVYLFSLRHALEGCTLGRARRAISALAPSSATILRDGRKVMFVIDLVQPGDQARWCVPVSASE